MIKNQLYPYIEKYFNELLYGFRKEQFDIGVMNGNIKFEKLNLRPDGVNKILDDKNYPFWLKFGIINKIYIGCSLMNFIGEKPLDVLIDGIDIILTPSYKWIIRSFESFIYENIEQMKDLYDPDENNSMNIFERKVNIVDNSVFKNELIYEIFKDGTKISKLINNLFKMCYKFYYMQNFLIKAKLKNIHIRFEDDQLINYAGNIGMGIKIESAEITLSSEGIMKNDFFKINNLDIYWEKNAKILISNDLLNNSIVNGELNQNYYENIKKINFKNFKYIDGTIFIVKSFNCAGKLGTLFLSSGKVDIFGKRDNQYKMFFQLSSNEININVFPELIKVYLDFKKFIHEFNILEQVQDFKPMRKPYDIKSAIFKMFIRKLNENRHSSLSNSFLYKRKMLVRDWLFYFYWCQKCKSSVFGKTINLIRLEFNRFYGLCFDPKEEFNNKSKEENEKEEPNPENINLFLSFHVNLKGLNINIHSSLKEQNKEYLSLKIIGFESMLNSNHNLFDLNASIKNFQISPNKIITGEKLIVNSIKKSISVKINNNKNIKKNEYIPPYNLEDNSGLFGLVKKYNPNYEKKVKLIDNVLDKIESESRAESRAMSEIDNREFIPKFQKNNNRDEGEKKDETRKNNYSNKQNMVKNYSFADKIILNYEGTPMAQKMELTKQKKEFSISQAINEYNNRKSRDRISLKSMVTHNKQITGVLYSKNQNNNNNSKINDIIFTGKKIPLNFIEIYSSLDNSKCLEFKYAKNNLEKITDNLMIKLGIFRINLIDDYIYKYLNILSDYKTFIHHPIINSIKNYEFDLKSQKELYKMQKYIYDYLKNISSNTENDQMKEYKKYLKKELNKYKLLGFNSDNFEINYLISLISKGFDINIDYESIELIYYGNDKKYNGKGIIPSSEFHLRIQPNLLKFNFFDFEFELNNLENQKNFISNMKKIFEEKLKITKLVIEPCISKIRGLLNNQIQEKNKKENKKLENILSLVQENLINKKVKNNKEEIINIKKGKEKNIIYNIKDNCDDDDLNDLNLDDSLKLNKIKVKIPNHFYSETISLNNKKKEEKKININNNQKELNNNKNKPHFIKKNNLPKVNKK